MPSFQEPIREALRDLSGGHLNSNCRSYLAWRVLKGDVSEDDVYKYLDTRVGIPRFGWAGYPGLVPYFFYTLHASYWKDSIGVQYRNTCSRKHDDIMELFEKLAYEASHCRALMLEAAGDRFIIKVNVYRGWQNKVTHKK